ncbi:MAG TPA: hypothetical protein VLK35_11490 [Methylomirabilota bacterium]|nr:hypothetical protein [Methylomirabilota bacterium]
MARWRRLGIAAALASVVWSGAVDAADSPEPSLRLIPDLHLSISEAPGEVSLRFPLASENRLLYGLLSPYLSLGSAVTLGAPWSPAPTPGLGRDADGLEDLHLGAGMAVPISGRVRFYGEYRFLRGRLEAGTGHGLLQRDDSTGFRAGFSIRLD